MLEPVVERRDFRAGGGEIFEDELMTASTISFPRGSLGQERTGPMGFGPGLVHACAHLLQPALEEKDAIRIGAGPGLAGHVRRRWCQLRFIAHDRTVPALEGEKTRSIVYSKKRPGGAGA